MQTKLEKLAYAGDENSLTTLAYQVADLFVAQSNIPSREEKHHFDYIIENIVNSVSRETKARLSERLSITNRIAEKTVLRFAEDDDIEIARPVLSHSPVLSDKSLKKITLEKNNEHRRVIATRSNLSSDVTEALTQLGDQKTLNIVTQNKGARWNHKALENLVNRADPTSGIYKHMAENSLSDTDLGKIIQSSLNRQLRNTLVENGLKLDSLEFQNANQQAAKEVKEKIKQERLAQVEAMVAHSKINAGQASIEMMVSDCLAKDNFTGAIRILELAFAIEFEHLLNAMKQEDETPLALIAKAAELSPKMYQKMEIARCKYFHIEEGNIAQKLSDYNLVTGEKAANLLIMIRRNIAENKT